MVWNDTTNRQGLVQDCEDLCGLGATGITSSTTLFAQFTRWANKWNLIGAKIAINAQDGFDFDDPSYSTFPSGTFVGTTNRDYNFDDTMKMLKLKLVALSFDGSHFVKAKPADTNDPIFQNVVREDTTVDSLVGGLNPIYDPHANGIDIYPKFTSDQVTAGAKVYVEFYREPKSFAITGTDSQEPGFASPFHQLISKGASYEYACLYKPDLAVSLRLDLYGNNATIPGIVKDMEEWYSFRYPQAKRIIPLMENPR